MASMTGAGAFYPAAWTFPDRRSAGIALAAALARLDLPPDTRVLALPRGGVPVGFEVAKSLHVPLHVMVVRKIGMPGQRELAIGAIGPGGVVVREPELEGRLRFAGISWDELERAERHELERRERVYRSDAGSPDPSCFRPLKRSRDCAPRKGVSANKTFTLWLRARPLAAT